MEHVVEIVARRLDTRGYASCLQMLCHLRELGESVSASPSLAVLASGVRSRAVTHADGPEAIDAATIQCMQQG